MTCCSADAPSVQPWRPCWITAAPRKVELLVLVDRGHRELPIQADYIGRSVDTRPQEQVDVLLEERDGRDEVLLTAKN